MKRKTNTQIKKEILSLKSFLSTIPSGKMLLSSRFKYQTTSTIDRWLERGIPSHRLNEVTEYIAFVIGKRRA